MTEREDFLPELLPGYAPERMLGEGLWQDVSHADYHADPCRAPSLSSSVARRIVDESPLHAHAMHPRLGGGRSRTSRAMDRGTIVHLLLLGKGQEVVEVENDDYRPAWARSQRDNAYAEGKVPVLSRELEAHARVARLFREKLLATVNDRGEPDPVVFDGESELTGVWLQRDKATGNDVFCRLRADHWRPGSFELLDVKTTEKSVSPRSIARMLYDNGADIQAAHYVAGMERLVPAAAGRVRMRFAFLEMNPPHDVVVVELDGEYADLGRRRWRRACARWGYALRTGEWPGHSAGTTLRIGPPAYAKHDDLDAAIASVRPDRPEF